MYKKILLPLENSPADQAILDHIKPLARLCQSELVLVHVADGFVARNQERLNLQDSEEMRLDREYLERVQEELMQQGFKSRSVLLCGDPARELLNFAQEAGCDLIAMATHGHRFLADLVLGSVAEHVRHRIGIPILMVRARR